MYKSIGSKIGSLFFKFHTILKLKKSI